MTITPGDTAITAQLGLCVGGLVRTWTEERGAELWRVDDPDRMRDLLGVGRVGRTLREERRYREAALLFPERGALLLPSRMTATDGEAEGEAWTFAVESVEPAEPGGWDNVEVRASLAAAIEGCLASGEFLVVELGGWDAPPQPYCLFLARDGRSNIEAAPAPARSSIWAPHVRPGEAGATMIGPLDANTPSIAGLIMTEAIATWGGVTPWDVALTFGRLS